MPKNILQALGKIDVALGGKMDDATNIIDALEQISERIGNLKESIENINSKQIKLYDINEYNSETGTLVLKTYLTGRFN